MKEETVNHDQNRFNWLTILLFIGGLLLPFIAIIIAIFLDKQRAIEPYAGYLGLSCEFLALVFGLLSWRQRSSKAIVAVILVGIAGLVGLLFMAATPSNMPARLAEPKAVQSVSSSATAR